MVLMKGNARTEVRARIAQGAALVGGVTVAGRGRNWCRRPDRDEKEREQKCQKRMLEEKGKGCKQGSGC